MTRPGSNPVGGIFYSMKGLKKYAGLKVHKILGQETSALPQLKIWRWPKRFGESVKMSKIESKPERPK